MTTQDAAFNFTKKYDVLGDWLLRPGEKIMLGDKENRICRFCEKTKLKVRGIHQDGLNLLTIEDMPNFRELSP